MPNLIEYEEAFHHHDMDSDEYECNVGMKEYPFSYQVEIHEELEEYYDDDDDFGPVDGWSDVEEL